MKITLAQLDFQNGFFERNTEKIILAIREAEALEADLVVFPELAIGGTPANDFLEYDSFGEQCSQSLKQIADACEKTACIIGIPSPVEADNKRFFNSAGLQIHRNRMAAASYRRFYWYVFNVAQVGKR